MSAKIVLCVIRQILLILTILMTDKNLLLIWRFAERGKIDYGQNFYRWRPVLLVVRVDKTFYGEFDSDSEPNAGGVDKTCKSNELSFVAIQG